MNQEQGRVSPTGRSASDDMEPIGEKHIQHHFDYAVEQKTCGRTGVTDFDLGIGIEAILDDRREDDIKETTAVLQYHEPPDPWQSLP